MNNNVENNQNNNSNALNNNTINIPNNNALNNNTTNISNNISKENREELVKLYVGANYEQIALGGFSYCCFLFGWGYLFYRKYYKATLGINQSEKGKLFWLSPFSFICIIVCYQKLFEHISRIISL